MSLLEPKHFSTSADGSNSFLQVSSHSGDIDVYVGDGGSAELHSQEGKRALEEEYSPVFLHVEYIFEFTPHPSVVRRRGVCACALLVESCVGALWHVGGHQPRSGSAWSREQHR